MERFKISRLPFGAKMKDGEKLSDFVIRVYRYFMKLFVFDFCMDHELSMDMIQAYLNDRCAPFVINYHINGKTHTIPKFITLLKDTEDTFKLEGEHVLLVEYSGSKKGSNNKKRKATKPKEGSLRKTRRRLD